jgi:hypothetical protein
MSKKVAVVKWMEWPKMEEWTDKSETIVLVGDAACPIVVRTRQTRLLPFRP